MTKQIKIHFIGTKYAYDIYHFPLKVFETDLEQAGLFTKFYFDYVSPGIYDCDVLIIHEDYYRDLLPIPNKNRQTSLEFLSRFFENFNRVYWFDGNAGSGALRNYVFEKIDGYLKSSLVKPLDYYLQDHPTGIAHRVYVVQKYGIPDPLNSKGALNSTDTPKLAISWNRAFMNWNKKGVPYFRELKSVIIGNKYLMQYNKPNLHQRKRIIQYRMNYWSKIPTVKWWRETTRRKLEEVVQKNSTYKILEYGRVNKLTYDREIMNSVVTISPFGLGEICYRDFESFIFGSLLFKPSMEKIQTWPAIYEDGTTYISHNWDFSDFNEKLDGILSHPERYEDIAYEGQKRFRKALIDGPGFAQHFKKLVTS